MVLRSIYPSLEDSARLLPSSGNIKFIFRHSLRPTLQGVKKHEKVRLTIEGEKLATELGESISYSIGELHSSIIPRCIQTINCIMENRQEQRNIILSQEVLTDVFAKDREIANISFKKIGSLKKLVYNLQSGEPIKGFRPFDDCISMILDYIFSTGNKANKLDLYCTHDLQLAMLNSALFYPESSIEVIEHHWPNMLEGMFFWGKRENFYCVWRGRIKRHINCFTMKR